MSERHPNDAGVTRSGEVAGRADAPAGDGVGERPHIQSDGRYPGPTQGAPPDPRAVIDDLRRRLRLEQEKSLNAIDAVLGARAAAAQARAETQEIFHRLHVRETELEQLKQLLAAAQPGVGSTAAGAGGTGGDVTSPAEAARALLASLRRAAGQAASRR